MIDSNISSGPVAPMIVNGWPEKTAYTVPQIAPESNISIVPWTPKSKYVYLIRHTDGQKDILLNVFGYLLYKPISIVLYMSKLTGSSNARISLRLCDRLRRKVSYCGGIEARFWKKYSHKCPFQKSVSIILTAASAHLIQESGIFESFRWPLVSNIIWRLLQFFSYFDTNTRTLCFSKQ